MRVCVIGHHKSAETKNLGSEIDKCAAVVRMKSGYNLCQSDPENYGTRTDYLAASTETLGLFKPIGCKEYWAYPKNGYYNESSVERCSRSLDASLYIDLNGCNTWNAIFRKMGGRHPNVTLGMFCIITAAKRLRPKEIVLVGMDTILRPDTPIDRIETVARTGAGAFPNHDWGKERELLEVLKREYGFSVIDSFGK